MLLQLLLPALRMVAPPSGLAHGMQVFGPGSIFGLTYTAPEAWTSTSTNMLRLKAITVGHLLEHVAGGTVGSRSVCRPGRREQGKLAADTGLKMRCISVPAPQSWNNNADDGTGDPMFQQSGYTSSQLINWVLQGRTISNSPGAQQLPEWRTSHQLMLLRRCNIHWMAVWRLDAVDQII